MVGRVVLGAEHVPSQLCMPKHPSSIESSDTIETCIYNCINEDVILPYLRSHVRGQCRVAARTAEYACMQVYLCTYECMYVCTYLCVCVFAALHLDVRRHYLCASHPRPGPVHPARQSRPRGTHQHLLRRRRHRHTAADTARLQVNIPRHSQLQLLFYAMLCYIILYYALLYYAIP